jgi:spermidine synthase
MPQKILVLGGGDGLINRELLKYPQIKSITHVELDEKMIEVAKTHPVLSYINKGALEDPRVKIKIADAYQYIKNTDEKYDAIYIDFPSPVDYDLSKLFSREFYHFVRRSINKNGFAVIDSPGSEMDLTDYVHDQPMDADSDWKIYFNTLKAAGFDTIIPFASNLDFDNPEAYKIFAEAASTNPKIDMRELESEIREYVLDVQKGFIMIKPGDEKINEIYKEPGVPLYVLNEKRFPLAFASVNVFLQEKTDEKKVNSIMRPTFPSISFWDIRLPY